MRPERDAHDVGVAQAGAALGPRDVLQLLPPPGRVGVWHLLLADHVVEHEVQQAVLAADMPVQRRGAGAELLGEPSHAERCETLTVEQMDRRGHDRLPADRLAAAPGRPVGQPLPGRRRDLRVRGHRDLAFMRRAQSHSLEQRTSIERRLTRSWVHDRTLFEKRI
jgi:hypothetical protein